MPVSSTHYTQIVVRKHAAAYTDTWITGKGRDARVREADLDKWTSFDPRTCLLTVVLTLDHS